MPRVKTYRVAGTFDIGMSEYDSAFIFMPIEAAQLFFKLPDDGRVAVFEILRVAFDQDRKPFRLTISVYPSDRNQFAINVGQVPAEIADPAPEYANQQHTASAGAAGAELDRSG